MPSIYTMDVDYVAEKNIPPELRKAKRLALLRVLLAGLKRRHQDIFGTTKSFVNGDVTQFWSSFPTYSLGDHVRVGVQRWECITFFSTGEFPKDYPESWKLIAEDFVGCDMRVAFRGGKMSMEYALNLYLNGSPTATPPIYIATQGNAFPTMMINNNAVPFLNYMSNNAQFQQTFMANTSTYTSGYVNYIVYVPSGLFYTLGATYSDAQNVVRGYVDRWNCAGFTYDVLPY